MPFFLNLFGLFVSWHLVCTPAKDLSTYYSVTHLYPPLHTLQHNRFFSLFDNILFCPGSHTQPSLLHGFYYKLKVSSSPRLIISLRFVLCFRSSITLLMGSTRPSVFFLHSLNSSAAVFCLHSTNSSAAV